MQMHAIIFKFTVRHLATFSNARRLFKKGLVLLISYEPGPKQIAEIVAQLFRRPAESQFRTSHSLHVEPRHLHVASDELAIDPDIVA